MFYFFAHCHKKHSFLISTGRKKPLPASPNLVIKKYTKIVVLYAFLKYCNFEKSKKQSVLKTCPKTNLLNLLLCIQLLFRKLTAYFKQKIPALHLLSVKKNFRTMREHFSMAYRKMFSHCAKVFLY